MSKNGSANGTGYTIDGPDDPLGCKCDKCGDRHRGQPMTDMDRLRLQRERGMIPPEKTIEPPSEVTAAEKADIEAREAQAKVFAALRETMHERATLLRRGRNQHPNADTVVLATGDQVPAPIIAELALIDARLSELQTLADETGAATVEASRKYQRAYGLWKTRLVAEAEALAAAKNSPPRPPRSRPESAAAKLARLIHAARS
jgi:hypothetical protein